MKKAEKKDQNELITIALAVYNPNEQWLKELLISLNMQTYQTIELIVCDDASEEDRFWKISDMIEKYITNFPFRILRNDKNIGSNQTFMRLILEAAGEYISFCDQDDIWMNNKLESLYHMIKAEKGVLGYCDMQVIDKNGKQIVKSLKEKRKRLNYVRGENLAQYYIFRNCTAGCSMLLHKKTALMAEVIPEGTYWDHWLCILASIQGKVCFTTDALVKYRIHEKNQSGILAGIENWEDYYQERILGLYRRVRVLHEQGYHYQNQQEIETFAYARKNQDRKTMWKYRYLSPREVYFEIVFSKMPCVIFKMAEAFLRKS